MKWRRGAGEALSADGFLGLAILGEQLLIGRSDGRLAGVAADLSVGRWLAGAVMKRVGPAGCPALQHGGWRGRRWRRPRAMSVAELAR